MPPEIIPDDSDYASEEDSDFAPDAAPVEDAAESSESEAEVEVVKKSTKRKRVQEDEAEDAGFENSGDEAIIEKGLKRRSKKKGKKEDEDEGGEGGLVKTRSMRAAEKTEKKTVLVDASKATVDVDALWANMIAGKPAPAPSAPIPSTESITTPKSPEITKGPDSRTERSPSTLNDGPDAMIMIKRTYTFAGKVHTEQKLAPRSSAEAKLYLSTQTEASTDAAPGENSPFMKPKRPTKKARRSIFEPVPENLPQRTDLHFGVNRPTGQGILAGGKEKKLNTVEKSAMDWAGFVDKEGIADELDAAGKAKGAFKARQEFLARVEGKREIEERRARGLPV